MTLKNFIETYNDEYSKSWEIEIFTNDFKFKWKIEYGLEALNPKLLSTTINNWGIDPKDSQIFIEL
ncbi:hypothetical protein VNN36_04605 [Lactococcus garvieae]|uniref:hypothetical protein n=1 Tax=Lactococcus garvieae TaxID=1363 RepID=UPI0030CFBDB8